MPRRICKIQLCILKIKNDPNPNNLLLFYLGVNHSIYFNQTQVKPRKHIHLFIHLVIGTTDFIVCNVVNFQ